MNHVARIIASAVVEAPTDVAEIIARGVGMIGKRFVTQAVRSSQSARTTRGIAPRYSTRGWTLMKTCPRVVSSAGIVASLCLKKNSKSGFVIPGG